MLDRSNVAAGLQIDLPNGVTPSGCPSGRLLRYQLFCDPSATPSLGKGPTLVLEHNPGNCGYTVQWNTSLVCHPQARPASSCPAGASLPVPSPEQLEYQRMGVGALISFNMVSTLQVQSVNT
jgi:hypothetical protein